MASLVRGAAKFQPPDGVTPLPRAQLINSTSVADPVRAPQIVASRCKYCFWVIAVWAEAIAPPADTNNTTPKANTAHLFNHPWPVPPPDRFITHFINANSQYPGYLWNSRDNGLSGESVKRKKDKTFDNDFAN